MTAAHRPLPSPGALRGVEGIYPSPRPHMVGDGFRVLGYAGAIAFAERKLSPFLLLDYHPPFDYPPTEEMRGVGAHPHRGFETVTIAWQGSVAHRDSAGHRDVIQAGDVQWMTAASGILHEELHAPAFARAGGTFHMAQLWVNLPKSHKMAPPRYQALSRERIGEIALPGEAGTARVIAGELFGARGPAETVTPVALYDVHLRAGRALDLSFPADWNASMLIVEGDVVVQRHATAHQQDLIVFESDAEAITVEAESDTHLLVMAGEPILEPIARYGPFVMNTHREIEQAMIDFGTGAMGEL